MTKTERLAKGEQLYNKMWSIKGPRPPMRPEDKKLLQEYLDEARKRRNEN